MLVSSLRELDFAKNDGSLITGLVAVADGLKAAQRLDEAVAVREARAIGGIDYIFFRRFEDERSSQIVAYVIDNERETLDERKLALLHKKVWLHGGVPLIYVAWPMKVDILSCARGPDFWRNGGDEYNPAQEIKFALDQSEAINESLKSLKDRFSAWRLADGTFWDDPRNASLAKSSARAHEALIQAVVETDEALKGESNPLLRRLLLLTVLIKYLEDRHVFKPSWFGRFCPGARSFFTTLRDGQPDQVIRLLKNLEKRFNGDLFVLSEKAQAAMSRKVLVRFAKLVEARTINQQRYLWEQFSFEHIPVEIVSHLYQRFVKSGRGTVYTPPFLASLILDFAMPYAKLRGNERVLDPACGSGVFLVGALRRLVTVWRSKNEWAQPDVDTLKAIVRNGIFGVELDPGAIDLAGFSLALAMCDALKPEVIWRDLRFDLLGGKNLFEGDFFSELIKARNDSSLLFEKSFDIILGNPPFESDLTSPGKEVNDALSRERDLPDQQAAYLFLEQAAEKLSPEGRLCLIQPSGYLYNRKATDFRVRLFRRSTIEVVLDFTSIRNLFEPADPKAAAVVLSNESPADDHRIVHLTFRRTFGTRQRITFEIDHYDRHVVSQAAAIKNPFVWRVNLLGGGRLSSISDRLQALPTLESFIESKGLSYGEGFIIGNRARTAPFLTGMHYLPAKALTAQGVDGDEIGDVTETHFEASRAQSLYNSPLLLIKKHETLPLMYWDGPNLAFTSTIVGIGVGQSEEKVLRSLAEQITSRHRTYRLACVLHGSKAFVAKATAILKQDIDALPFPDDPSDLDLSFWEEALQDDVLDFMCDFVRLGQKSELLRDAATAETLRLYTQMLERMLGSVYSNIQSGEPIWFDGLVCQPFFFGETSGIAWQDELNEVSLRNLIYQRHHESLRTVRMLRFYGENCLLIVKPDRLRFWIRSTAIRDADETIGDLRSQGY